MQSQPYHHEVQIYYEDTDHSGAVYHPSFLKYFERAREHVLGIENLSRLWHEQGIGFAVYKVGFYASSFLHQDARLFRSNGFFNIRFTSSFSASMPSG